MIDELDKLLDHFSTIQEYRKRPGTFVNTDGIKRKLDEVTWGTKEVWDIHQRLVMGRELYEGGTAAGERFRKSLPEMPEHDWYWPTVFRAKQLLWRSALPVIIHVRDLSKPLSPSDKSDLYTGLRAAKAEIESVLKKMHKVIDPSEKSSRQEALWIECFGDEKVVEDLLASALNEVVDESKSLSESGLKSSRRHPMAQVVDPDE